MSERERDSERVLILFMISRYQTKGKRERERLSHLVHAIMFLGWERGSELLGL